MKRSAARHRQERFRIIAGRWRGRTLRFTDTGGVRPTPDRVRETLFNWLQPTIDGSRCLDLFAGTGALGLEAASRGARRVVFVESDTAAVRRLRANIRDLAGEVEDELEVVQADAPGWLRDAEGPFDVVFVDPPYASGAYAEVLSGLSRQGVLAAGACVYVEHDADGSDPAAGSSWRVYRRTRAGRVVGSLLLPPETA